MSRNRARGPKKPTWTSLVFRLLIESDDFHKATDIAGFLGANGNQVTAALCHLRKVRAVDCLASDGQLFWFATPATDQRVLIVEMRTPEDPGTRRRGRKARPVTL